MIYKIKNIILISLTVSGLVFLFSFAASYNATIAGHSPKIRIESSSGNYFINTSCVEDIIRTNTGIYQGQAIDRQTLGELYNTLSNMDVIENAKTYMAITGRLGIEIDLRNPVIRVINNNNESFYIDEMGYLFPLSDTHTARVMIAAGNISTSYSPGKNISREYIENDNANAERLAELFEVASFVHGDDFWRSFIDQIYVLPNGKLELIPKNAFHTIEFGSPDNIEKKFGMLKAFYINGLSIKGWHHYNTINLEFNNQIICSK